MNFLRVYLASGSSGDQMGTAGNTTILAALAATLLTGVAGLATVYVQGADQKAAMQSALDAGVLAGTALGHSATESQRIAAAHAAFNANVSGNAAFAIGEDATRTFRVNQTSVSGQAFATVENSIGAAFGITSMDVEATATALKNESDPLCLLTLGKTAPESLHVYGNAALLADCPGQVNSSNSSAVTVSGSKSRLEMSMLGVTGGSSGSGMRPEPIVDTPPVDDPYAHIPVPPSGSCQMTNAVINTSTSLTPGTYCGGLTVKSGAIVTLQPGNFVMLDGQFRIDSGGHVDGNEVLIALVGDDSYIYMNSKGTAKLTSPKSGPYKNMQFMSDRDLSGSKFGEEWTTILGGASLEYDGVMYLPEQQFYVSGTAHESIIKAYSPTFAMIVDAAWVQGNTKIEVSQTDRRGIGTDDAQVGFLMGARLVK